MEELQINYYSHGKILSFFLQNHYEHLYTCQEGFCIHPLEKIENVLNVKRCIVNISV